MGMGRAAPSGGICFLKQHGQPVRPSLYNLLSTPRVCTFLIPTFSFPGTGRLHALWKALQPAAERAA